MSRRVHAAQRLFEGARRGLVLLLANRADQAFLLFLELLFRKHRGEQRLREDVEEEIGIARQRGARDVHSNRVGGIR